MSSSDLVIRKQDLTNNPTPRVPICLVLDCSPSMSGNPDWGASVAQSNPTPIDALNDGVQHFFQSLREDIVAVHAAEVAIVAFSGIAQGILDFQSLERLESPPRLILETQHGGTCLGSALKLALQKLDERKGEYQDVGVDYFQPWIVLMTDGKPTDDSHLAIRSDLHERINQRRLSFFPIGVGEGVDMSVLSDLSPKRPALHLKGFKFNEFFEWLSKSVSRTSQSMPGEEVALDQDGIKGWGTL
ncbi:MAG: VWA domain-containing protein [Akkermansiaceae bacterium]|nr:VWA domain-containing protein [Akkermansiaceae bacterium]